MFQVRDFNLTVFIRCIFGSKCCKHFFWNLPNLSTDLFQFPGSKNTETDPGKRQRSFVCCFRVFFLNDYCRFLIFNEKFCFYRNLSSVISKFCFINLIGNGVELSGSNFTNFIFSKAELR